MELLQRSLNQKLLFNQLQFSVAETQLIDHILYMNQVKTGVAETDCLPDCIDGDVLDYCRLRNITIQPWSPLQFGFKGGTFLGQRELFPELNQKLDELAEKQHLSKPYLSKYIKEKSGNTFGDIVKNVRMKKARTLLKNTSMTVENIADNVGYQNVEHFNRTFKKKYDMTPIQFRNSQQEQQKI